MDSTYSEYFADQKEKRIQKFVAQILADGPSTSDEEDNEDDHTEGSTTISNTLNDMSNVSVDISLNHTRSDESSIFFPKHSDQDRKCVAAHVKRLKKEMSTKAAPLKPRQNNKFKQRQATIISEVNQHGQFRVVSLINPSKTTRKCQPKQ